MCLCCCAAVSSSIIALENTECLYIPSCRYLHYQSEMDIFVAPELSNLTKLSVIHLSGSIGGYEAIGTFSVPDLQELVIFFNGNYKDHDLPNPVLPLFDVGALVSLTKLELDSFAQFSQVSTLPWHSATFTQSTSRGKVAFSSRPQSASFSLYRREKFAAGFIVW